MQTNAHALARLSDEQLLTEVPALAACEREATARLIAALGELDARRLWFGQGFSSLFAYCTQHLHLSEDAACNRIEIARAARKWPVIVDLLADGSVSATAVRLLASHLTDENHRDLLAAAMHKSKREVEQQIAALRPLPPVPSSIRKLPAPKPSSSTHTTRPIHAKAVGTAAASVSVPGPHSADVSGTIGRGSEPPARRAEITPLSPERFKVQFTASREMYDRLRRVQDLLRHSIPNGDPAAIFDRALTLLLADLERRKLAQTTRPRNGDAAGTSRSRYVPAAVRREVWARDGARCAFVGPAGRCTETGFLELHHVEPFADGGATTTQNLQLRCRAHNAYEAEVRFGRWIVKEAPPPASYGACHSIRSGTT